MPLDVDRILRTDLDSNAGAAAALAALTDFTIDAARVRDLMGDPTTATFEKHIGVKARTYRRRATNHAYKNALLLDRAAALIERPPAPGETIHLVVAGDFRTWDIIPSLLRFYARPAAALWIATLSWNRDTLTDLLRALDAGQIGHVSFITSSFEKAHDPERFTLARDELTKRGHRILAMRNHCKILALDFGADKAGPIRVVTESSANLRGHSTTEQITITRDPGLYDFHAGWMDDAFRAAGHRIDDARTARQFRKATGQ